MQLLTSICLLAILSSAFSHVLPIGQFASLENIRESRHKTCGVNKFNNTSPFIVGGKTAVPNSHPWQVSLFWVNSHMCGGSIISEDYILSAAHCFTGTKDPARWTVKAGKQNIKKTEETERSYAVEKIIKHSGYNIWTNVHDVALLKVATPIKFDANIRPICLASSDVGPLVGQMSTVTGWGTVVEGGLPSAELQEVQVPIISNDECQKKYSKETIFPGNICAGYEQGAKDACQNDSGGPMVILEDGKWTQAGIVSWGYGCARPHYPGIYTRVSEYKDWIDTVIEK